MAFFGSSDNQVNVQIKTTTDVKAIDKTTDALGRLDKTTGKTTPSFLKMSAAVAAGQVIFQVAARALRAIGTAAISNAADYEQSLNIFQSVSGATGAQMGLVAEKARELGKDLTLPAISSSDAALAMVELSKAGLSVNDTLGASKGVLSLAKAGQLDTAAAAEIAANALNAFSLSGEKANMVADVLAAGANASSANVQDLAYGMQMASASAANLGIPIDDLVTALGLMSNNGIKAQDAGTSLKTLMTRFAPVTDKAEGMMKKLNLSFFDAKGNFVGLEEATRRLQKTTKNMTQEQRQWTLYQLFGSDAIRAANILVKEGVDGFNDLSEAVNKEGAATKLAAAQNKGFKGALDGLKSALETIGIDIGMKVLPVLTKMVHGLIDASDSIPGLVSGFMDVMRAVGTYLLPKLENLWNRIKNDLIPALRSMWQQYLKQIATFVGGTLVVVLGVLIDTLAFIADHIRILMPLMAAWGALMVGSKVKGAITSVATSLGGTGPTDLKGALNGIKSLLKNKAMWTSALKFGVLAAMIWTTDQIIQAWGAVKGAIEQSKNAAKSRTEANEAYNIAKDAIMNSKDYDEFEKQDKLDLLNKKFGKNQTQFSYAKGTNYHPGGTAIVGEEGPELVDLPRGSKVHTADETKSMLSGGGVTIQIMGNVVNQTPEAANAWWDRLDRNINLAKRGLTTVKAR